MYFVVMLCCSVLYCYVVLLGCMVIHASFPLPAEMLLVALSHNLASNSCVRLYINTA